MGINSRKRTLKLWALLLVAILLPSLMAGCISDDDDDKEEKDPCDGVTINLASPAVASRDVDNNTTVWDVNITVNKITPKESVIAWSKLNVIIKDAAGSVLLEKTALTEVTGDYGTGVKAWYYDMNDPATDINATDVIVISSMTSDYQGATMELVCGDNDVRLASASFPTDFP